MRFAFTVAWRFLREGRFQSMLIVVGVAAGVAVVTYISALITGLQANTINRTLGTQAHIIVKPLQESTQAVRAGQAGEQLLRDTQPRAQRLRTLADWRSIEAELLRTPNIVAATSVAAGAALAQRGEVNRAITLMGIDLDSYDRIVALRERVVSGAARVAPGEALVGRQLADDLGLGVGDRLLLRAGTNGSDTVKIAGLFDLGSRDLNRRFVYTTFSTAQSLLGVPGGATNVYARVAELFGADATARSLRQRTGLDVESWMESNAQLLSALSAQSISTGLIRVFTALVVVLGIASVLVVSVVQKRKEIGILRAMGATRAQLVQVFLMQGAIVGGVGSLLGVGLAQALLWGFTTFVKGSDGQPLFVIGLTWPMAIGVAVGATLAGVLAAAAPARSAARLDPAQAIRL